MNKAILYLLPLFLVPGIPGRATILNDSLPPGKNFEKAAFRMWYPDGLKQVRAIVVMVPGSNGDGRGQVADSAWQSFAAANGLALLGCYFTDSPHPEPAIELYVKAGEGSGDVFLEVIGRFSKSSGHAEMIGAPMLMWGHSAGGQFNYEFVCWKPEHVLGFVVNKGGIYYTAITSAAARQVPGIFFTGEKDLEYRSDLVKGIFAGNRRFGALWTIAEEPGAGHEVGQTKRLAIFYFDELLRLRLGSHAAGIPPGNPMKPLSEETGLIGDPKTHIVLPFAEWKKTTYPTAWLPTPGFSEKWFAFVEGKAL